MELFKDFGFEPIFFTGAFKYSQKVSTLKEIVRVDAEVNGCPMVEQVFLKLMKNLLADIKKT